MSANDPVGSVQRRTGMSATLLGGLVMFFGSLLLSWLPLVGSLIAGVVGGRIVGEPRRALLAALLPAIGLAAVIVTVLALFDMWLVGAVAGAGVLVVLAVWEIPLLLGAWFGGATARP